MSTIMSILLRVMPKAWKQSNIADISGTTILDINYVQFFFFINKSFPP